MNGGSTLPVMVAVVTLKKPGEVNGGMAPIFYAKDEKEREKIATYITRITNATVHDLEEGTFILTLNA